MTFDCDLDRGRGNLTLLRNTTSCFALFICEVRLNSFWPGISLPS